MPIKGWRICAKQAFPAHRIWQQPIEDGEFVPNKPGHSTAFGSTPPREQHRFFVHGDEAEVFSRETDAAFLQGDHDLLRAVAREAAVLLDEQLPVAGEREPRQTVQTEGRDLQPLRREIDDVRDSAHKTTPTASI